MIVPDDAAFPSFCVICGETEGGSFLTFTAARGTAPIARRVIAYLVVFIVFGLLGDRFFREGPDETIAIACTAIVLRLERLWRRTQGRRLRIPSCSRCVRSEMLRRRRRLTLSFVRFASLMATAGVLISLHPRLNALSRISVWLAWALAMAVAELVYTAHYHDATRVTLVGQAIRLDLPSLDDAMPNADAGSTRADADVSHARGRRC